MPLSAGHRIGPYEVLAPLGAGGMGEVYRARDARLGRDVALKVLPSIFASDPERMGRFEREARVLASLTHSNIAALHGLQDAGGAPALVMELVEGQTLAERIAAGPVPADEAVHMARQIVDALEYAHERGIVHRDLKPANIKVTPEGSIKVLDFGLAKAMEDAPAGGPVQDSPTLTMGATRAGVILGTAAYMAPEQAKGRPADRRADIWAFGVVLYEMLSGKQAFSGDTAGEILASVIKDELPLDPVPPRLRPTIARCLRKDPRSRWQAIGDVRIALDEDQPPAPAPAGKSRPALIWIVIAAAFFLLAAGLGAIHFRETPPEAPLVRTFIPPPERGAFDATANTSGPPAISPDGRRLAFSVRMPDGKAQLWIRPLDSLTAQPLAGTESAMFPFWAPDSRHLAFFSAGKLRKIDTFGGPPVALADVAQPRGGSWGRRDVIVFAPTPVGALMRVNASGGTAAPATTVAAVSPQAGHAYPCFLPDGNHFLYSAGDSVKMGSLDSPSFGKEILKATSNACVAMNQLLFVRQATLMAQPFDLKRLEAVGEAVPVGEQIQSNVASTRSVFTASDTGVLAFLAGRSASSYRMTWMDRSGKLIGTLGNRDSVNAVEFSPDHKTVAAVILDAATRQRDNWLFDVARGIPTRFNLDLSEERDAIFSPDGTSIIFNSNRKGHFDLYRKAINRAEQDLVYADETEKYPASWSRDGKLLLYFVNAAETAADIYVLPLTGDRKPVPLLRTKAAETRPKFSPDGRWIAYVSNASQQSEIYVISYPCKENEDCGKLQISRGGGSMPRWRADGREIYYLAPDGRLTAVSVKPAGATLEVGEPQPLFGPVSVSGGYPYDVSPDGQKFLIVMEDEPRLEPLTVVQNWTAVLNK